MKAHRLLQIALVVASSAAAQTPASIQLVGRGGVHHTLTRAELAGLPHVEVKASAHNVTGTFRGVLLRDVLALIKAPLGDSLRGAALASYVLVEAKDNYRVVFALAELDAGFTDKQVLLADAKDGQPLSEKDGPFQIIVPDEKRPARWVREVVRISVVSAQPVPPRQNGKD